MLTSLWALDRPLGCTLHCVIRQRHAMHRNKAMTSEQAQPADSTCQARRESQLASTPVGQAASPL
jgi:hypothetical protein